MSPRNGVYIVQGEMSLVVSALRRNARWGSHNHQDEEQDPLLHGFSQLKDTLSSVADLGEVDVNVFLGPFLDVIRSEDTTGPITGVALSSVNKFLSYGLIEPTSESAASGIENLADAVTHARFVGTDPSSDEVVLMKILQVLRTLLLTPVGAHMTNESVCEIMQSCFRICFETRLSELLRRSAEQTLMDMVQLLFSRLPQFKEESRAGVVTNIRRVLKRAGAIATGKRKKHMSPKARRANASESPTPPAAASTPDPHEQPPSSEPVQAPELNSTAVDTLKEVPTTAVDIMSNRKVASSIDDNTQISQPSSGIDLTSEGSLANSEVDSPAATQENETMESCHTQTDEGLSVASQLMQDMDRDAVSVEGMVITGEDREGAADKPAEQESHESVASTIMTDDDGDSKDARERTVSVSVSLDGEDVEEIVEGTMGQNIDPSAPQDDYVNPRGVRFTPQEPVKEGGGPLIPYGLPCVRELFRFLISLTNPHDRHNSEPMIHMGLSLLTVALESGAQYIGTFSTLMNLVKDDMCRNVFMLLQCDVLGLFAMSLRVCFLLFESLRGHLKFQMEMFFKKLMDILAQDQQGVHYEKRELILDAINQLFRVPNLVTELYLNYDCDLYCTNVFEELCKLLSKNAFPAGSLYSVHLLALDALLAVVQSVESHCHSALLNTVDRAVEEAVPADTEPQQKKSKEKSVDSDSGTDESCDFLVTSPPSPPASGYLMVSRMTVGVVCGDQIDVTEKEREHDVSEEERVHRLSVGLLFAATLPTAEALAKLKQRKKLLQAGTDQFNNKPKKGIEFLQEHSLLSSPLNPAEMAKFLRENPKLDKKMVGDYIGDKRNSKFLDAFVSSFHFHDHRIDEGLRAFLESFRLPGESPVIEHIMESFSEIFYEANPEGFANKDAVFTLTYAVIMLNVDQHNSNIKQQKPMTLEDFKRNLRKTNGGSDFSASMLEEVYHSIRNEEIVMPAERSGRIKENYDWKVLLHRSITPEGKYIHGAGSSFDQDLFLIIWGPTVAALSYVYDNGLEKSVVQKAIMGFRKCALISAHYGLSDVFDNLVISLCKFTTLLNSAEAGESLPIAFGSNLKAQLSARTMFALAHRHGDILREGWKNIMDCMLQLFKAKLLPKSMVEAEDFVEASGRICLLREELPSTRPDSSIFSWYQYLVNPEPAVSRGQTAEDKEAQDQAQNCIRDCHPEMLITESKFLRYESLNELIKVLTFASNIENQESMGSSYDEEAAIFFLELLIRVVLQNRDRVSLLWQTIRDHLSNIIVSANQHCSLVERAVVGLLRLAIRLLRKEEVSSQVLITLRVLLLMKFNVLRTCGRQISFGLHELLRTSAANINTARDWTTVFTLLECVGASATVPVLTPASALPAASKDVDTDSVSTNFDLSEGATGTESDTGSYTSLETESGFAGSIPGDSWLLISKEDTEGDSVNQYDLTVSAKLNKHDSKCFVKSCQSLTFLIRDGAHVSRENFLQCVHAARVFAEGILNGGAGYRQDGMQHKDSGKEDKGSWGKSSKKSKAKKMSPTGVKSRKFARSTPSSPATSEDEAEIFETINNTYDAMSLQLVELMHALHTRAASFYEKGVRSVEGSDRTSGSYPETGEAVETESEMSFLWTKCWCPLLQGIAQLCCDNRRDIRMSALTYLQRALLVHDLQSLTAVEWESCFNKVLFPMLTRLLEVSSPSDPIALEETRMRAATLLSKVFLQHLNPLLSLSTFTALWLTILDFMDKYMHADKSDLLYEAIPESLKNMLLVMSTAGIFDEEEGGTILSQTDGHRPHRMSRSDSDVHKYSALWQVTWERIDCFLPNLKQELFVSRSQSSSRASSPPVPTPEPSPTQSRQAGPRAEEPSAPEVSDKQESQPSSPPVTASVAPAATPSVMSPPTTQQVCVMLQPPLPSLSNRSSSPTQLGSLADNVRPASVPIILAPSPSLTTPSKLASPGASPPGTPSTPTKNDHKTVTEPAPIREDCSIDLPCEDEQEENAQNTVASPERPKASVYDI